MTILLVEQNANHALRVAHRGYVLITLERGRSGAGLWPERRRRRERNGELLDAMRTIAPQSRPEVRAAYLATCVAPTENRARLAQAEGVSSLAVATWRLGFAALIITPVAFLQSRHELARLTRRQIGMALAAGFFLALHFATWISSLEYTSVASSTALVTTNPLWIGLASFLIFRETPTKMMIGGIALSFAGSLLIFWSDSAAAPAPAATRCSATSSRSSAAGASPPTC
jgi:hypothetical protein